MLGEVFTTQLQNFADQSVTVCCLQGSLWSRLPRLAVHLASSEELAREPEQEGE